MTLRRPISVTPKEMISKKTRCVWKKLSRSVGAMRVLPRPLSINHKAVILACLTMTINEEAPGASLFAQTQNLCSAVCSGRQSETELDTVPAMLDHVFSSDHRELVRQHYLGDERSRQLRNVVNTTCMRPADHENLYSPLDALHTCPGRACTGGTCSGACSRVSLKSFASADECEQLAGLASKLLPPPVSGGPRQQLMLRGIFEKMTSSSEIDSDAALQTFLILARLMERSRRAIAYEYGLELRTLSLRSGFLTRVYVEEGSSPSADGAAHVDEHSNRDFHYSCVVYLTGGYEGGELIFSSALASQDDDGHGSRRNDELVKPDVGHMVMFSSGWEHLHHVASVRKGDRIAMPLFFTTNVDDQRDVAAEDRALCFERHVIQPQSVADLAVVC